MSAPRITAAGRLQRLLAVLQHAAAHPEGIEVDALCARFGIAREALVRDLDLASMIGADSPNYDDMPFEVFVEDGLVYVRLFSFRRPMRLTPAEGLALVASAHVLVDQDEDPDGEAPLARALAKLAGLLGIEPGQVVDIDVDPDGGELGLALRGAIADGRAVAFTYWTYGRDQVARRVVDPWALDAERNAWYLVGWSHDAGAPRTFRLDRMEALEVLDQARSTAPPDGLQARPGHDEAAPRVVLELAPSARWVADAHPILDAEPVGEDRVRVTLAVSGASWLERLLLRLGPEATVVEIDGTLGGPDLAAAAARRVLARYLGDQGAERAAR